jgi:hypothetical protein
LIQIKRRYVAKRNTVKKSLSDARIWPIPVINNPELREKDVEMWRLVVEQRMKANGLKPRGNIILPSDGPEVRAGSGISETTFLGVVSYYNDSDGWRWDGTPKPSAAPKTLIRTEPLACRHDIVVDVRDLMDEKILAKLCECCSQQLPAEFDPPAGPEGGQYKTIQNQYGEVIGRWATKSGEWVIVRA